MEPEIKTAVETAKAHIARAKYQTTVSSGKHTLLADEPETLNGTDTGMNPYGLLLASLGSCTAITLRMYIDRKMWVVDDITVNLELFKTSTGTIIDRKITFTGELSDEQKQRLLQIANSCPVHKILTGNIEVSTELGD